MIEAHGLVKRYGSTTAVDDLSFSIRPGLVTGFLGPNGAGKTTTMRMILGLDAPTQGSVTVAGRSYRDLPAPMREVGALLDAKAVHGGRRARDRLLCLAQSNCIARSRVEEVLGIVGLEGVARRRAKGLSLGMAGTDKAAAEQGLLDTVLTRFAHVLAKDQVWLMDRLWHGVRRIAALIKRTHVLIRIKSDIVVKRVSEILPDGSYRAEISGDGVTITVRVIEYDVHVEGQEVKEMFCLITDLLHWREYPALELAGLYKWRWDGSETGLREAKAPLHGAGPGTGAMLRSGSPALIAQEIAAWASGTEMTRGVTRDAARDAAPAKKGRRAGQPVRCRDLSLTRARRRGPDLAVYCKAWPVRGTGGRFTKDQFSMDFAAGKLTCPAGVAMPFQPGTTVQFPKDTCATCPLRQRCTSGPAGRSVAIHPDEALLAELRERQQTPAGRAKLRERVQVEHTLAHIGHWQGRRARYLGTRKNLFDLRRVAVVHNLHVIAHHPTADGYELAA
jgi:ABC-type transport system involved in cytochrome c biogenesis ATPase subunit